MKCWPARGRAHGKTLKARARNPRARRPRVRRRCRRFGHHTRRGMRRHRDEGDGRAPRRVTRRGDARGDPIRATVAAAGFSPTRLHPASDGFVGFGNPPRATASSRRIPSRTASTPVDTAKDASRRDGAATARPRRVARGPDGPIASATREPRGPIAAEGELGDARARDDARCAGGGFGTAASWGRTHHVCYVRLCVLSATRAC